MINRSKILPMPVVPDVTSMTFLGTFSDGEIGGYVVDLGSAWFVTTIDLDSGAQFFQLKMPKQKWPKLKAVKEYLSKNKKLGPLSSK